MLKEFQKFIMRGNVLDLAVGIIIGAAFTSIVNSLVNDVVMPIVGLITGGVDFSNIFVTLKDGAAAAGPYATLAAAQEAGAVTVNLGVFINAVVNFLIVGLVIFLIVRSFNTAAERFQKKEAAAAAAVPPPAPTAEEKLTAVIEKLTAVMEKKA
jgi:large conductance mechanosensitive channel